MVTLTTPAKPLIPVTVTVDMPAALAFTVTLDGLALIVKSCTVKDTVALCERPLLVPFTPTWTVEIVEKIHDSAALPEPVTLVGVTVHEVLLVVMLTTLAKPLIAVTVIVDVPAAFTLTLTVLGLAVTVKSWTWNAPVTL